MAKSTTIKVKLVSSADTGFYYVTKQNSRTQTDKLVKKKYDPVARKHVEFREAKIKKTANGPGRRPAPDRHGLARVTLLTWNLSGHISMRVPRPKNHQ